LCEGGELFDRLDSDGNFSEEDARKIFTQIMEALSYCHSHKIAHRDLKPENFMFVDRKSLNLKLIDFGLAYRWK
jgi:serine/threonine protein kinase